jgi:hypothetical protein
MMSVPVGRENPDTASDRPKRGRSHPRGVLAFALIGLSTSLLLSLALKSPCAERIGRESFTRFCYTDIVSLYHQRHLSDHKIPYVEVEIEYPVLTGVFMWVTALPVDSPSAFFLVDVVGLWVAAVVIVILLHDMVGIRVWYFAIAPSLLLFAFLNWDLLAVALATAALWAHVRDRQGAAGVLIGLGAAAKLYPALLLVPFVLGIWQRRDRRGVLFLLAGAAGAWLFANAYFFLAGFDGWAFFYKFSAYRGIDRFSLWSFGCRILDQQAGCGTGHEEVNLVVSLAFVATSLLVWRLKVLRTPNFERWTFAFPLLILFLLTNKVYSPQYSLWLIPWFPLVLPNLRAFLLFEAADAAVFFTTFSWLGSQFGFGGLPESLALAAVLARGVVLMACVALYVVSPPEHISLGPARPGSARDRYGRAGRESIPQAGCPEQSS